MIISRICTDPVLGSVRHEREVVFESMEHAPPAPTVHVSEPTDATRHLFVQVPAHWGGIEPNTPYRELCVILEGGVEITTSDGRARKFAASSSFVVEDTGDAGHLAGNAGTARPR